MQRRRPELFTFTKETINGLTATVLSNTERSGPKLYSMLNKNLLIVSSSSESIQAVLASSANLLQSDKFLSARDEVATLSLKAVFSYLNLPDFVQKDWLTGLNIFYSKKYQQGNIISEINLSTSN